MRKNCILHGIKHGEGRARFRLQKSDKTFVLLDHVKLRLKDQEVFIGKAASKDIYGEI